MILAIGEILFDVFPDYRRIGGAPFNFSVHLKRLGFQVRFVSRIGDDPEGREILDMLRRHGFDPHDLQVDHRNETGKVTVALDQSGVPDFDILQNVAYDHIDATPAVDAILQNCTLIYFGTLIQRTAHGFDALQRILSGRKSPTKCFYDINLRPRCFSEKVVRASLHQADVLKLNQEELEVIQKMHGDDGGVDDFVAFLREHYTIDVVALTRGEKGARLFTPEGCHEAAAARLNRPVDTVGAGDAFAAVLAAGYLRQQPPEKVLKAAVDLAARVCRVEGAIPDNERLYAEILRAMER